MSDWVQRYFKPVFHTLNGVGTLLHLIGMAWLAQGISGVLNPLAVWVIAPALLLMLLSFRAWGTPFLAVLLCGAACVFTSGAYLTSFLLPGPSDAQDALVLLVLPFFQVLMTMAVGVVVGLTRLVWQPRSGAGPKDPEAFPVDS